MSLVFIRHGETELNAARVLQPPDTPLGPRGREQAAAVGRRFANAGLVGIISSDLARARETAQAISQATGLPILESPLLQERNFGALRGLAYDSLGYDPIHAEEGPPGGETMTQFRARVALAFAHVLELRGRLGGDLAIVTHGLLIRETLAGHLRLPAGMEAPERLANTSVTVALASPPHDVTLLNCARHLDEGIADDHKAVAGI